MSELIPVSAEQNIARPASPMGAQGNAPFGSTLFRLKSFAAQPAVAKSLPAIALIALLGLGALAWALLSTPPHRDLFAGLADGDKAAMADALKASGINYAVDRQTGTISVSEADYYQAKMLLASQGLPKGAPDSNSMIGDMPMGASRAVEDQRLRAGREMDLARTIEAIDAVQKARVHLAVEPPSVFLRDRAAAAASVMLQLKNGRGLAEPQVRAITHLVASSIPGLTPEGVAVIDQNGRLLSRSGGDAASEASDRQIDIQQRIEARYVEAVTTLLTPLVGAGNFTTEVHADLDFAQIQATRETYPKDTAVVRAEQGSWTKDGAPDGAGGIPGALSNQPPPASQVAAAPGGALVPPVAGAPGGPPAANRTTENYNRTFEFGREISVTKQPVGTVRRLSVAVALRNAPGGKPRSKTEIAALDSLVKGAVGFDQARGDQIAISARGFAEMETPVVKWWEAPWVSMVARNLTAVLVVALLVFGIGRPLMKRRAAAAATKAAQSNSNHTGLKGELSEALTSHIKTEPGQQITLEMIEAAPGYAMRAELVRSFVRQDPARAALVVRDLIRADIGGGSNAQCLISTPQSKPHRG